MKLSTEETTYIKEAFNKLENKEDLLSLLNFVKPFVYGHKYLPFQVKQLNYHSDPRLNKKRYITFFIRKKSGQLRTIHAPNDGLKAIQKCLNIILQTIFEPHACSFGFIPNRSVVDNASRHVNKNYVYNIDLKDFFPSVEKARLYKRLLFPPFNLNTDRKKKLANVIAGLCCQEMDVERLEKDKWIVRKEYVLPQGAPTSPTVTNIICERLDRKLAGAAKKFNLTYSRYADDITFSSNHNQYQKSSEFLHEIEKIISEQNFVIKATKTRLQKQGYRQEVTGVIVNRQTNVNKRYIKQVRMWLFWWETFGKERANEYFLPKYKADKGHVKKGQPDISNVIGGKLNYLRMVRGYNDPVYNKLVERYVHLVSIQDIQETNNRKQHIDKVLSIFVKEGLESAMKEYKPQFFK